MAKLGSHVERHSVTFGNYPMVPAGQEVFKKAGRKVAYNVVPGQFVAYVIENGTTRTVDAATLTASDLSKLMIGVGHDSVGNRGIADSIRHIGIDHISGCNLDKASTSSPSCGSPEVHDFFFDCTKCDETYTVMVTVDDNGSRSFAPFMKSGVDYIGSVVTECHTCDDCPAEHNCKEIACKLADALNGDCDLRIGDERYPDWKGNQGVDKPFFATRLHERSLIYCIAPASEECVDCNHFPAITGVTVLGETLELVGNVNPADPTQTLIPQLHCIVDQINEAYKEAGGHQGSAYLTGGGQSDCCPLQIHINTCDETFAIEGLTPTVEENPFEAGTRERTSDCIDCGEEPTTQEFNCGIRIIAAPLKGECGCLIEQPLAFYGRTIEVKPIGEGWTFGYWYKKKVQDMQLPAGFGSWIQWLEYKQTPGGDGRTYNRSNYERGWLNQFDKTSRANRAVTSSCKDSYCSFFLKSHVDKLTAGTSPGKIDIYSNVHIPTTDDVTLADFYAFYEALLGFSDNCNVLEAVECHSNKDFCDPDAGAKLDVK